MSEYCYDCGRTFGGENELLMHEQVHLPTKYECFKCNNRYRKYSDMIGHVEYGCGGIVAEDLNKSAAMLYQWKYFLKSVYRSDMLGTCAKYNRNWDHQGQPWHCPSCGKYFKKLSSLFQHAWSAHGEQAEDEGLFAKLKRWLWNRHA